jgi:hypothetical protein
VGPRGELVGSAVGGDFENPGVLLLQGIEKGGFVGEALVLDELQRAVILSASKRRLQILEGERGRMRAFEVRDEVSRREKDVLPWCFCTDFPCLLYTVNRVDCSIHSWDLPIRRTA